MPLQSTLSLYRRTLKDTVYVRRFSGSPGSRTHVDYQARASVKGAGAVVLIGSVEQNEYTAIVLIEDLVSAGLTLPITVADQLVINGRGLAITIPDDATRSDDGQLVAYVLKAKG